MQETRGKPVERAVEEKMVREAQSGSREAMELLFQRYRDPIYQYLLHMTRNAEEAADLTQETFIRMFQSLSRLREAAAFRVWLYRIAVNLVRDEKRRAPAPVVSLEGLTHQDPVGGEEDASPVEVPDWRENPEEEVLRVERHHAVHAAIDQLSEEHRQVIVLHHLEDLELRDISQLLGIPVGTVKSRLARARAHLHRLLAGLVEGVSP